MGRISSVLVALPLCAALSALAPSPALAQDSGAISLDPASDWQLREYADKCRVSRTFGAGDNRTTLRIDQGGFEQSYNITVIGRPVRTPYGSRTSVQFVPQGEFERDYISAESSKGRPVLAMFGVRLTPPPKELTQTEQSADKTPSDGIEEDEAEETVDFTRGQSGSFEDRVLSVEQIAQIESLRLGRSLRDPLVLKLTGFSEAASMLSDCATQLDASLKENSRIASEAGTPAVATDVATWARIIQQNYPAAMLRREEEGSVGVRVTVGANGRPSYCEITKTSGSSSFNDTVCLLMLRHATFNPARDAQGNPLAARYSTKVTFRLNR